MDGWLWADAGKFVAASMRFWEVLGDPGRPWPDQAEYRAVRRVPGRLVDGPERLSGAWEWSGGYGCTLENLWPPL
jgi:hypothetical protein